MTNLNKTSSKLKLLSIPLVCILVVLLISNCTSHREEVNLFFTSPSENIQLEIDTLGQDLQLIIVYSDYHARVVLENISKDIEEVASSEKKEEWKPVYGERTLVRNHRKEILIQTKDSKNRKINVLCRLYDEGFAIRYNYDSIAFRDVVISSDNIHFTFQGDHDTWVTGKSQGAYSKTTLSQIQNAVERPIVIEAEEDLFFALGEAAVVNYPRSKITQSSKSDFALTFIPDSETKLEVANYMTPWRCFLIGESAGALLEKNYILQNLSDANKILDTSWIKPGKVLREVTLTTEGGKACVDFAATNGLQYVEFDAGWYGNEYSKESDATTITIDPNRSEGPLDLHEIIAYGKEKGIGVFLYVNRNAMLNQLDEILPLYRDWGVAGVKYGFVYTGSQKWNIWLHEAIRKAAENKLMVDIHDDFRPTGYSRTYPNLLTQEGVRGDEESPSVEQSIYTIFIRGIGGASDNTNCFQAERVKKVMGGKAAQMAKAIMIYSPLQFLYWYDRPEASPRKKGGAGGSESILSPDIGYAFYAILPTTWDESKVLSSKMGDFGSIARRSGDDWFLGALNANMPREVDLQFDFLSPNFEYEAIIYSQDEKALLENHVDVEKLSVNSTSRLVRDLPADSGLAIVLKKS